MRRVGSAIAAVVMVLALASTAGATSVNFATMGDLGAAWTYTFGDLTLSARSGIADGGNPFTGGAAAGVYIGILGSMDAGGPFDCDPDKKTGEYKSYCGAGVQSAEYDKNGKFKGFGGSNGISGEGGDQNESLIFDFTMGAPGVVSNSVVLTLVGLNGLDGSGKNNDVVDLTLDYWNVADQYLGSVNAKIALTGGRGTLNFADLALNSQELDRFAVRAIEGHFGVSGITYEVVPEPATMLLLGTGLLGLGAGVRRRLRRR